MNDSDSRRSYESRLGQLGALLDAGNYHGVVVVECEEGLIVRVVEPGTRTAVIMELLEDSPVAGRTIDDGIPRAPHQLFSSGYQVFLRALGRRLDLSQAEAITIVESVDFVTIGGVQPVCEQQDAAAYEPLDILLLASDIQRLTAAAPTTYETGDPTGQRGQDGATDSRREGRRIFARLVFAMFRSVQALLLRSRQQTPSTG